jgi:hypothetical protein
MAELMRPKTRLLVTIEETGKRIEFPTDRHVSGKAMAFALDERMELALSRDCFAPLDAFHLRFEIACDDRIVQTLPGSGALYIDMAEVYADHWFV